jgi:hypothetical protein
MLRKFVIEREVPGIGDNDLAGLGAATRISNRNTEDTVVIDPTTERRCALAGPTHLAATG